LGILGTEVNRRCYVFNRIHPFNRLIEGIILRFANELASALPIAASHYFREVFNDHYLESIAEFLKDPLEMRRF
jgi:hypothetical protein